MVQAYAAWPFATTVGFNSIRSPASTVPRRASLYSNERRTPISPGPPTTNPVGHPAALSGEPPGHTYTQGICHAIPTNDSIHMARLDAGHARRRRGRRLRLQLGPGQ